MTTKDRLILMEEIKRKNDLAWRKYSTPARPRWTWDAIPQPTYNPFTSTPAKVILVSCLTLALVSLLVLAGAGA